MKHRTFAAAMGLLTALLIPGGPSVAASADPTGFWTKQEASDYPAKMEIRKCGKGQLCAKIAWLQVPTDSKGKLLHDVRNEDPSMRDRPILNLPIFNGLSPAGPGVWTGDIYNPEDGHIYTDIKLTVVSRSQIVIRGCKAWLLCGEKIWTRTSAPPAAPTAEPEQQEAKAQETPAPKRPMVEAAAEETAPPHAALIAADPPSPPKPTPKPNHSAAPTAPETPTREANAGADTAATESLPGSRGAAPAGEAKPPLPSPWQHADVGYDVLLTAAHPQSTPFSSESVSSIFVFIPQVTSAAAASDAVTDAGPESQTDAPASVPLPAPKPTKPRVTPRPLQATATADPLAVPAALPTVKPKPVVKQPEDDLPWL
ncbi:MAG: DUF2147 domain-containing protein, partial [Isosphaeraceae bacterium]